jgi:hypothetical protein
MSSEMKKGQKEEGPRSSPAQPGKSFKADRLI